MAGEEDAKTAIWTLADDTLLINTLTEQKIARNWGDNNPKKKVWTACKIKLEGSEKRSGGLAKGEGALKNRWQKVHAVFSHTCTLLMYAPRVA
jgi:hypothetical protein